MSLEMGDSHSRLSVILPTYNRADVLAGALRCLRGQRADGVEWDLLVVDNNSPDDTRQVVHDILEDWSVRWGYVLEGQQGVSHARNRGIAETEAPLVGFIDDDVRPAGDWVRRVVQTFDASPELDCVGGRVLPDWRVAPPEWLTRAHWMPLGLIDYGDQPFDIDPQDPCCLVGANMACRREAFARAGGFPVKAQRRGNTIGSLEDHDWLVRLLGAGGRARYLPELRVTAMVPAHRMTREYHRRWHAGHGYFYAIMRFADMERSRGHLFDVPLHLYRQALVAACRWTGAVARRQFDRAFELEMQLRFFAGFFRERFRSRGMPDAQVGQLGRAGERRSDTRGETSNGALSAEGRVGQG